jgi:sarcosine oxidase
MGHYRAIVAGLGAMGSATAYQLARRGVRVLGIDLFSPPHALGSTHGDTRITRLAIGEGGHYTPLALRSHEIWREIEQQTGADLLTQTGALIISSPAKTSVTHVKNFFANTLAAAKAHGIAHEMLGAAEIRRRFPQFAVRDDEAGYFEHDAGFVRPEACVAAQLKLAQLHGAEIRTQETLLAFESHAREAVVVTDRATHTADILILTVGPWLPEILGERYGRLFQVSRQVLCWFAPNDSIAPFLPGRFPVFIWELQTTRAGIYGFPAIDGGGIKIATEHYLATTTPGTAEREVSAAEIAALYETCVAPNFPGLSARCVKAVTCLYTVTPDFGFVIDAHPECARVIVASPCSGHGFKHSAAIGEALAELVVDGKSRIDLGAFAFARF